eukprot:739170-Rhodomonas_salina.2
MIASNRGVLSWRPARVFERDESEQEWRSKPEIGLRGAVEVEFDEEHGVRFRAAVVVGVLPDRLDGREPELLEPLVRFEIEREPAEGG